MDQSFEEILLSDDVEKLNDLKRWLFEENIRLEIKQKELNELHEKFINEKVAFVEEMKAINLRNVSERKRLKDEEMFFDKKMEILKDGFRTLKEDRRKLEREMEEFEASRRLGMSDISSPDLSHLSENDFDSIAAVLFANITNPSMLRKRYKDLVKIFHPDNLCGDERLSRAIN